MFGSHKILTCNGGEWTTVIHTRFAQLPMSWRVGVLDGALDALGEFEETKSAWIIPGTPTAGAMQAQIAFVRGYWNTFYKVRIRPIRTIKISVDRVWV
jgi:hypothetical protein